MWGLVRGLDVYSQRIVVINQYSYGFRLVILSVDQNVIGTQVTVQNPDMIV
jgi:hypothetical protein